MSEAKQVALWHLSKVCVDGMLVTTSPSQITFFGKMYLKPVSHNKLLVAHTSDFM